MYNIKMLFLLPEIIISTMACFILILDLFVSKFFKNIAYYLTQFTIIILIFLSSYLVYKFNYTEILFSGSFVYDFYAINFKMAIFITAFFIFLYSKNYINNITTLKGEFFVLSLLSIFGMMIIVSSGNFITLYIGLELLALPIYSLIIMNKSLVSSEASIKYFIMGSIASGIFLFGVSLVYGMTGVIDFNLISDIIYDEDVFSDITLQYGMTFIIAGLIFKFGAVPFHLWVPDVYEGAPITITMFIGTIPKIAALGMAYRLISDTFGGLNNEISFLFTIIGCLSLLIGNIFALTQNNLKRMLGYSTIAHVGFIFIGLIASDKNDFNAISFYIFIYVISILGAFGIIILLSSPTKEADLISDYSGLINSSPLIAIIMMIFLLSLAGIPPTAGFFAKFLVIRNMVSYDLLELALFAALMSVLGSYYYLKVIKVMFFDKEREKNKFEGMSELAYYSLIINGLVILILGFNPKYIRLFDYIF